MTRSDGAARQGPRRWSNDRGQATVEFALLLPILFFFLLVIVQVAVVVRGQLMVVHAAREAARAAAVEPSEDIARGAAVTSGDFDPKRMTVRLSGDRDQGGRATAEITYKVPTKVPLVGNLIGDVEVRAKATMRVE